MGIRRSINGTSTILTRWRLISAISPDKTLSASSGLCLRLHREGQLLIIPDLFTPLRPLDVSTGKTVVGARHQCIGSMTIFGGDGQLVTSLIGGMAGHGFSKYRNNREIAIGSQTAWIVLN